MMETDALLEALGYSGSPNCLTGRELRHAPDYGHVFRRAAAGAGLQAVYCLRSEASGNRTGVIPVTYVCKATSYEHADEIHRLVWNQNVVPFLVVLAPQGVRVYTGFERQNAGKKAQHLFDSQLRDVANQLAVLSASSIDSGRVWDQLSDRARPSQRVEWRLLADLATLERVLAKEGLEDSALVHTLIGKLLYLHYLRHRDILSDARLSKWDLTWEEVASRNARVKSFLRLCTHLEEWLNGSVFPLTSGMMTAIGADHLQRAAGVFAGDTAEGQLHLSFDAYDFSYIPIETLSVVYEQFLHLRETSTGTSVGRKRGAYYTPIPVVNFMIDRMEDVKPLHPGMRVLDPACGSGAFLVQCYRKLIEDRLRAAEVEKIKPTELRELLVRHIFGVDVDGEACRVAELSLLLTMLDYIDPPDLTNTNFKLPALSGANVIEANAFNEDHEFLQTAKARRFEWVIGNPPWNEIAGNTADPIERPVLEWIVDHRTDKPTGGNQSAEPFLWRASELLAPDGVAGLLVPAMVLFKTESKAFRERFFRETQLRYVANFANLAEVLFAGRSRVPAAALIFSPRREEVTGRVPVFSPLVANQEATRPRSSGRRVDIWSLVVNENELRFADPREIARGDSVVWKLAAWGTELDRTIIRRTASLPHVGALEDTGYLIISEGMQLRGKPKAGGEPVEHHPELAALQTIDIEALGRLERIFAFPTNAIVPVNGDETYVRKGRFAVPERVSRPPHILVNANRRWAIYSDEYLLVPPRQIGIAASTERKMFLKALTVYLNSEFVQYHQFFAATQAGVKREVSTLRALRALPVPPFFLEGDATMLRQWAKLHDELASHDARSITPLGRSKHQNQKAALLGELNDAVTAALSLRMHERVRVSDFINVVLGLRDGKVEDRAVRPPDEAERRAYAERLRHELDAFIGGEAGVAHAVDVWSNSRQGVIRIDLRSRSAAVAVHPASAGFEVMKEASTLRECLESQFSQWSYFNRNLRIFTEDRIFLFKPMHRFHWIESQAIQDAAEVVGLVLHRVATPA
jgi:N-6 DNA Methylase